MYNSIDCIIAKGTRWMGKLVRDGVPQLIRLSGRRPRVVQLDESEYLAVLHDKLDEEATELKAATSRDEVLAECADVFEVLVAVAASHGISLEAILEAAQIKRAEWGGFDRRLWLDDVDPAS